MAGFVQGLKLIVTKCAVFKIVTGQIIILCGEYQMLLNSLKCKVAMCKTCIQFVWMLSWIHSHTYRRAGLSTTITEGNCQWILSQVVWHSSRANQVPYSVNTLQTPWQQHQSADHLRYHHVFKYALIILQTICIVKVFTELQEVANMLLSSVNFSNFKNTKQ